MSSTTKILSRLVKRLFEDIKPSKKTVSSFGSYTWFWTKAVAKGIFCELPLAFKCLGKGFKNYGVVTGILMVVPVVIISWGCIALKNTLVNLFLYLKDIVGLIKSDISEKRYEKLDERVMQTANDMGRPIESINERLAVQSEIQKLAKTKNVFKLTQEEIEGAILKGEVASKFFNYENVDDNEEYYNSHNEEPVVKAPEKDYDYTKTIRKELLTHGFKLNGTVLKTTYTNISDEELYKSLSEDKPLRSCIIQQVTFGKDLDSALSKVLPQYRFEKTKNKSYFVLDENEVFDLEQDLQKLFMQNNISLSLRDIECVK